MQSNPKCWFSVAVLVLLAISAASVAAYQQPLSPESVREAYFLGRQTEQADAFLRRYTQAPLILLDQKIDVTRIELLTPYAQIVRASRVDMANQNAVDVDQEYPARSLPLLLRVWFYPPASYAGPFDGFDALVRKSTVAVSQLHVLAPQQSTLTTLYSSSKDGHWPNGLELDLTFDAKQFRASPVQIVISAPNGQHAEAAFNLSTLK
ncbi:MAG: hypothetical protein ACRD4R_15005 [Candidatus Acidiferrales bacterium]